MEVKVSGAAEVVFQKVLAISFPQLSFLQVSFLLSSS